MAKLPIERRAITKAYKASLIAERKMEAINKRAIRLIRKEILNSTKGGTYNLNKATEESLERKLAKIKRETLAAQADLQAKVEAVTISTMVEASKVQISIGQAKKIIKNTSIGSFSQRMRPSLNEYADDLLTHLKVSIGRGKGVLKLASELTKIDPAKVDIPKYIREIAQAARQSIRDPKDFVVFEKALRKNSRYINGLTREGETGFQQLGIRRASKKFVRDIKNAVNDNTVDNVVNQWAARKLGYIQKRVARTETSKAYHAYLSEYAHEADHIKGIRVMLSPSHPRFDSCDAAVGDYLFSEYALADIPIPPTSALHHPQCICGIEYIFEDEFLNNPEEFIEA